MQWDFKTVRSKLGGKLIGNVLMKTVVCETILFFPEEIIEYVTKNVWFFSSADDAWALDPKDRKLCLYIRW